jgi:large subunit ribosomal protein L28
LPTRDFLLYRLLFLGRKAEIEVIEEKSMSRCELTGKGPVVKNLVSHSNIKTKKIALPNVQQKRVFSRALNQMVSLKVSTHALRSMEHVGGFDVFLLNQKDVVLSPRALDIKRRIKRKVNKSKSAAQ